MKATLFFNTKKNNTDGEHPIWIRLSRKDKIKYVATGQYLPEKNWDKKKNSIKGSHEYREEIENTIFEKLTKYIKKIKELKAQNRDVSLDKLIQMVENPVRDITVIDYFDKRIKELKAEGRVGNAMAYQTAKNSLKRYLNNGDCIFSDIDYSFLDGWARKLRESSYNKEGNEIRGADNAGINNYMRTLRALFNHAIKNNYCKFEDYPFDERTGGYSINKNHPMSKQQKALTSAEMKKLIGLNIDEDYFRYMVFMYYAGGIDFVDLAHLQYNLIREGQIRYYRRKLINKPDQMEIRLGIHPMAQKIIEHYKSKRDKVSIDNKDYIFPILNRHIHESEQQKHDRIKKVLRAFNKELKVYASKAGITDNLISNSSGKQL
ncbi:MAG: site-specific integrase [Bacteroidales bacterium]|nr:site-specific integrase [Bacteroidales bacterium]